MSIGRILCAVDHSEQSKRALRHAAAIAAAYGAGLRVLHVLPLPSDPTGFAGPLLPLSVADVGPDPERALRAFVDAERLPQPTTCLVRRGAPAYREIGACAEEVQADLIVIGTHGSSGFDQVLLGSTAERLVNHASCPVITVPREADEPGSQGRVPFTNVLCAVDFSAGSLAALHQGLAMVGDRAERLTLLHVLEAVSDEEVDGHADVPLGAYVAQRRREAQQRMDDLLPALPLAWDRVATLVVLGRPAPAIVSAADARQADLIVMGAHGQGESGLTLFGSATQGVLRHATCPVLTAAATDGRRPAPSTASFGQAIV